jgi:hypothetical protein
MKYFNARKIFTFCTFVIDPVGNGFSEEIEARMKNDNRELYRRLFLVALIKKIVEKSDTLALEEFHNSSVTGFFIFFDGGSGKMILNGFAWSCQWYWPMRIQNCLQGFYSK